MDPNEFFFLILPLTALVAVLVVVVLHLSRKEETMKHKEVETISELMQTGLLNKHNFSEMLQDLVQQGIIGKDSFATLGKLLDDSLNENEETEFEP
jgi:hypothetical protein